MTSPSFPLLHEASWTPTVERHATATVGAFRAEYQRYHNSAKSSELALRDDVARRHIGTALHDPTIPEYAVRDILQARSFCFPTATLVTRNTGRTDARCALCHKAKDTYGHRFMECKELVGARHVMHDSIAKTIIDRIATTLRSQGPGRPSVTVHQNCRVDTIWPDGPHSIRDFTPDGVILVDPPAGSATPPSILIFEFARCYTVEPTELEEVGAEKRNQYHALTVFLRQHPAYRTHHVIRSQQYIMSVLGVIPHARWTSNLEELRFTPSQQDSLVEACMKACILAGHQLNNTVRSLTELRRARGPNLNAAAPRGIG